MAVSTAYFLLDKKLHEFFTYPLPETENTRVVYAQVRESFFHIYNSNPPLAAASNGCFLCLKSAVVVILKRNGLKILYGTVLKILTIYNVYDSIKI